MNRSINLEDGVMAVLFNSSLTPAEKLVALSLLFSPGGSPEQCRSLGLAAAKLGGALDALVAKGLFTRSRRPDGGERYSYDGRSALTAAAAREKYQTRPLAGSSGSGRGGR